MAGVSAVTNEAADLSLASVVGHKSQVEHLRRQLQAGSAAHAYWISGPPRVGKTTLALGLAAELLDSSGWPGGMLSHPDLWLDDGEGSLGIDRIRRGESDTAEGPTLQHFLSLSAFSGGPKVAVIANAERLTLPASNSLLQLLEEPPAECVICLTTSRPGSEHLPSTMRSRCQEVLLGPVDPDLVSAWLERTQGAPAAAAELAAALCQGRPGLAQEMVRDTGLEERTSSVLESLTRCAERGPGSWLELSRELAERGRDREVVVFALRAWAAFLRDCCCAAVGAAALTNLPSWSEAAAAWAERLQLAGCLRRYDLAIDALARLAEGATARLVLDRFLLLTFGGEPPAPPALGEAVSGSPPDRR